MPRIPSSPPLGHAASTRRTHRAIIINVFFGGGGGVDGSHNGGDDGRVNNTRPACFVVESLRVRYGACAGLRRRQDETDTGRGFGPETGRFFFLSSDRGPNRCFLPPPYNVLVSPLFYSLLLAVSYFLLQFAALQVGSADVLKPYCLRFNFFSLSALFVAVFTPRRIRPPTDRPTRAFTLRGPHRVGAEDYSLLRPATL